MRKWGNFRSECDSELIHWTKEIMKFGTILSDISVSSVHTCDFSNFNDSDNESLITGHDDISMLY